MGLKIGTADGDIPANDFNRILAALRDESYKQGHGVLQSDKGHCCLGVMIDLVVPKNKQFRGTNGRLSGMTPSSDQLHAPVWLKNINSDFNSKTSKFLSALNDGCRIVPENSLVDCQAFSGPKVRHSFLEIADFLELIYIDKILEEPCQA